MRKAQVPSHGGTIGATLGETIAAYRLSQSPNGKQWSQEELAFACGTHQAHLSLIENNQKHPQLWTLVRICDALGLRQDDRSKLLALAGYHVAPPLPDETAARSVLSKLVPILESYPYPTILMDEGEVTWHYNSIGAVIFGPLYGFNDLERFRSSTRGTRTFELLFDPDLFSRWKLYFEDLDNILMRVVLLFRRAYSMRPHDHDMSACAVRFKQNPNFISYWERAECENTEALFIEHTTYGIHHPKLGLLNLHAWRTHATMDERFLVVHFTPVDRATSSTLQRLTQLRLHSRA